VKISNSTLPWIIAAALMLAFFALVLAMLARDGAAAGDVATWVGSIGTVAAFIGLVYQVGSAQAKDRERAKREQAERISGWPTNGDTSATPLALINSSPEPVYEVVVGMVMVQGGGALHLEEMRDGQAPYRRTLLVLPPGNWHVNVPGGWAGMSARPGVEIAFTDRSGGHWIRRSNGVLDEINAPAIEYLKLGRPQGLEIPSPGHGSS
jgi:hypothetical protein